MKVSSPNSSFQLNPFRRDKRINWFADWWLDMAYLTYRDPVVVWSSPGFAFPKVSFAGEEDRLEYTAKMLVGILGHFAGFILCT